MNQIRSAASDSLRPRESQHVRPPCPSASTGSSLKLTSIESVMPSSHLILGRPLLLLPPVPPSIRVFSNESTLHMRWPKYWFQLQHHSFQINPRAYLLQNGLIGSPCSSCSLCEPQENELSKKDHIFACSMPRWNQSRITLGRLRDSKGELVNSFLFQQTT